MAISGYELSYINDVANKVIFFIVLLICYFYDTFMLLLYYCYDTFYVDFMLL